MVTKTSGKDLQEFITAFIKTFKLENEQFTLSLSKGERKENIFDDEIGFKKTIESLKITQEFDENVKLIIERERGPVYNDNYPSRLVGSNDEIAKIPTRDYDRVQARVSAQPVTVSYRSGLDEL